MTLTNKQSELMSDINFQLKQNDSAYIVTGRYKNHSALTVKSLMKKGLIKISYSNGHKFHSNYFVHLEEGAIYVQLQP